MATLEGQGLRPNPVLIEDAANDPTVYQLLKPQVPGLIAIPPKGSKASRAHAVAPLVEAGQLRFARKAESLVEELLAFSPGAVWMTRWMPSFRGALDRIPVLAGSGLLQLAGADGLQSLSHVRRHRTDPANPRMLRCGGTGRPARTGAAAAGGGDVSASAQQCSAHTDRSSTGAATPAPG